MSSGDTIEDRLQFQLQVLTTDDSSLAYFSSGRIDSAPDRTSQRWQLAVDMTCRCVVSGLIGVLTPKYRDNLDAFFHAMRTLNPYNDSGIVLWNGVALHSTDTLAALIKRHFPNAGSAFDQSANPAFIDDLRDIFAAAGVPWADAPLLPIVTS